MYSFTYTDWGTAGADDDHKVATAKDDGSQTTVRHSSSSGFLSALSSDTLSVADDDDYKISIDGRTIVDFGASWLWPKRPRFSPDLQWLYFQSDGSGSAPVTIWRVRLDNPSAVPQQVFADATKDVHDISFSADGQTVVYLAGELYGYSQTIHVVKNGIDTAVPRPSSMAGGISDADVSPDGTKLAVTALASTSSSFPDLWTMTTSGGSVKRLSNTSQSAEGSPSWSPAGDKVMHVVQGGSGTANSTIKTIKPDGTQLTVVQPAGYGVEYFDAHYRQPSSARNYEALLNRYAPTLAPDQDESYYADSAATITDAPLNTLDRGTQTLAAHDNPSLPELSLGHLGAYSALPTDHLSEADDPAPNEVANSFHGVDTYRNQIYGAARQGTDGKWWLQYWFFYYWNDVPNLPGGGNHEGDWEMVQIGFDGTGIPDTVSYAQHNNGMRCTWNQVDHVTGPAGQASTVVYPAAGTHATYPKPGVWMASTVHPVADYARGDDEDERLIPRVNLIRNDTPTWMTWPGKWGSSDDALGSSPTGPRFQSGSKWSNPSGWSSSINPCDTNPGGARAANGKRSRRLSTAVTRLLRPAPPSARLRGDHLVVRPATRTDAVSSFMVRATNHSGRRVEYVAARGRREVTVPLEGLRRNGTARIVVRAITQRGVRSTAVTLRG